MKNQGRWIRLGRQSLPSDVGAEAPSSQDALEPVHETQGRVELIRDTSAAHWIEERLARWSREGVRVGSVVPDAFAAYARILHPAREKPEDGGKRIRWSTVAAWTGRTVHPEMQFDRIANLTGPNDYPAWGFRPQEGLLPREDCERLASLLHSFTSTPNVCWFCIWEGYGFLNPERYAEAPRVKTPERTYLLFRGPLDAVTSFHWGWLWQSPNLWWPDDRAWCVATEIDLPDTYVGGALASIDRIVDDDMLEAVRTRLEARVDIESDTVNAGSGR